MALSLDGCQERAGVDLAHAEDLHAIELRRQVDLAAASAIADRQRIELLQSQIDASGAWYRSPPFVATAAATIAVAALLVSTVLVQSTAGATH